MVPERVWKVSKALDRLSVLCEQHHRQTRHRDGLMEWEHPQRPAGVAAPKPERVPANFAWDLEAAAEPEPLTVQPHESVEIVPQVITHEEPALADIIDLSSQEELAEPLEQHQLASEQDLESFGVTRPEPSWAPDQSAPVPVDPSPECHRQTMPPTRAVSSSRTRSPAPSVDSWSTNSHLNYRPRSNPSASQAGMHYVDYDQTSSLIGGSLLHKPSEPTRRMPTPPSSWAAEAYRTTYMDNFRWLQNENTGEPPSNSSKPYRPRPELAQAHAPRYGKRRRVLSGADAWAVAQQSARELFPPVQLPPTRSEPSEQSAVHQGDSSMESQSSRAKATVERAVQTDISAVSPSLPVSSQSDVQQSSFSPQQEKRHFRPGQSYESSHASTRSQGQRMPYPQQQQRRHFRPGETYESNSVAVSERLRLSQASPYTSKQQKRHFRPGQSYESSGVAASAPRTKAPVASSTLATPPKRPASRKQRSSTPLGASRLHDNPILMNQRYPPQPLTFSAQSTYEKEFKWLPRRR